MVIGLSAIIAGLLKVKRRICGTVAQHVRLCTIITSADVQKEAATILLRLSSLERATIGVASFFPARKKGVPAQGEKKSVITSPATNRQMSLGCIVSVVLREVCYTITVIVSSRLFN